MSSIIQITDYRNSHKSSERNLIMFGKYLKGIGAAAMSAAVLCSALTAFTPSAADNTAVISASAAENITIADFPEEYRDAADWIWNNRIVREQSTARHNTIFDQIVAGKGTINYVVRWQSYKTITYEQRKQFETLVSDSINAWTKWLVGYENWPYDHIDVKIVGWAVIDKNCLLDLHDDEVVYTDTEFYDSKNDTSNGYETIPDRLPNAPSELSRFDHFADMLYQYPGGLDKRFDMYLWATQGFPSIGGCGGDWGQRLSDDAYLNMLGGTGLHVLEHELGHGFGMTDFYGGEGELDGFPPGGFPGGENSLMMAGSAAKITDFDGWMLRYMWSHIKDEEGRFVIEAPIAPPTTEPPATEPSTDVPTVPVVPTEAVLTETFDDTIIEAGDGYTVFADHGRFSYSDNYYGSDESKNLANYEVGDVVSVTFSYKESSREIVSVDSLTLLENIRKEKGDVNLDGEIGVSDLVLLSDHLLGGKTFTEEQCSVADIIADGTVDVFDLTALRKMLIS